jgi:hypothetical protein
MNETLARRNPIMSDLTAANNEGLSNYFNASNCPDVDGLFTKKYKKRVVGLTKILRSQNQSHR